MKRRYHIVVLCKQERKHRNTVHEENKQKYLNILYSVLLNGNFDQWVSINKQKKVLYCLWPQKDQKYKWLVKGREKGKKNEQNEW